MEKVGTMGMQEHIVRVDMRLSALELSVSALLPPAVVDIPYVWQPDLAVEALECTMGNWMGAPTGYTYQWKRDGTTDIGTGTAQYVYVTADVDHSITCVVTATNANGSTTAPQSNAVVPQPPAAGFAATARAAPAAQHSTPQRK
jgi:PKD repeat protein